MQAPYILNLFILLSFTTPLTAGECNSDLYCPNRPTNAVLEQCSSCTSTCQSKLCAVADSQCAGQSVTCEGEVQTVEDMESQKLYFSCGVSACISNSASTTQSASASPSPSACNQQLYCENNPFKFTECRGNCKDLCKAHFCARRMSGCVRSDSYLILCDGKNITVMTAEKDNLLFKCTGTCTDVASESSSSSISPSPLPSPLPSPSATSSPFSNVSVTCQTPTVNECDHTLSAEGCRCCGRGAMLKSGRCVCAPAFSGSNCEVTCSGRGSPSPQATSCACNRKEYTGTRCEVECSGGGVAVEGSGAGCTCRDTHEQINNTCVACSGRGRLDAGLCVCGYGYSGKKCEVVCSGHGTLVNERCVCDSPILGGVLCQTECSGHGKLPKSGAKSCDCDAGFSGSACQIECSQSGRVVDGSCACEGPVYSGSRCELQCNLHGRVQDSEVCECNSGYVWNHTQCVSFHCDEQFAASSSGCACPALHTGPDCATVCSGHGSVVNGVCECAVPWGGALCADECAGHGTNNGFACVCVSGYSGPVCSVQCEGRGTVVDGVCQCQLPFSGPNCTQTCSGRGHVENEVCVCTTLGYSGDVCEVECSNVGQLVDGVCKCPEHFSGQSCEVECNDNGDYIREADKCKCASPLISGDSCQVLCHGPSRGSLVMHSETGVVDFWSFEALEKLRAVGHNYTLKCVCTGLYTGEECNTPCSDHGVMRPTTGGSKCDCQPLYQGDACDIECSNNGHIVDGKCVCTERGASGTLCEDLCNGHGTWDGRSCSCAQGYEAPFCKPRCQSMCMQGTCENEVCSCDPTWGGKWCQYLNCKPLYESTYGVLESCPAFDLDSRCCDQNLHWEILRDFNGGGDDEYEQQQVCAGLVHGRNAKCFALIHGVCLATASSCEVVHRASPAPCPAGNKATCFEIKGFTADPTDTSQTGSHTSKNHTSSGHTRFLKKGAPLYVMLILLIVAIVLVLLFLCCRHIARSGVVVSGFLVGRGPRLFSDTAS